jgi:Flp pilus assembly protein CpaB
MRRVFLLVGALLAVIVAVLIFAFWRWTQPTVYDIPVALADIPAGTVLRSSQFKVVQWKDLDEQSVQNFVTVDTFNQADGKVTTSDIRAGFPVARAQVDPNSSAEIESRLSLAITNTNSYYLVVPATPENAGNFVQPGDRVDLLFSLGSIPQSDSYRFGPDGELLVKDDSSTGGTGVDTFVPSLVAPISKLIVQNLRVLRVDREQRNEQQGQNDNSTEARERRARQINDVQRIYVEVDRDQLEVLSFVLNNGKTNVAVRSASAEVGVGPTEGVSWNDFMRWFYIQRNRSVQADSFDGVGPYEPAER